MMTMAPPPLLLFPLLLLLSLAAVLEVADALYVSYEEPRSYGKGERIPFLANKLVSSSTLSSVDYSHFPVCRNEKFGADLVLDGVGGGTTQSQSQSQPSSAWKSAVGALHGDALRTEGIFRIRMGQNRFCEQLCVASSSSGGDGDGEEGSKMLPWKDAIESELQYQFLIDGMPVARRYENTERVAIRYWGGIPVGRRGETDQEKKDWKVHDVRYEGTTPNQTYIYNHWNIEITYWKVPSASAGEDGEEEEKYRVVRTTIQPFSIRHDFDRSSNFPVTQFNPIPSCATGSIPTYYASLNGTEPQLVNEGGDDQPVLFTYDVIFTEYESKNDPWKTRWNVFLRMDDGIPITVQLFGLLVAVIINILLSVALYTWFLRDLSYKPLWQETEDFHRSDYDGGSPEDDDEEEDDDVEVVVVEQEVQLWPLSTRAFFPPRVAPLALCFCCGTGAQLLATAFLFLLFFRLGIVNESLGSNIVTPAVVLYALTSVFGGYISARMQAIFHGTERKATQACLLTATVVPIVGCITLHLVYDVLPDAATAPTYNVLSRSVPIVLIWIFAVIPLTLVGGYLGFRHGAIENFPVSEGSSGYQDLALQDKYQNENHYSSSARCDWTSWYWKYGRIIVLFLIGGILPVACSFVEYAYGVAGPVYVGYFSDNSMFAILSFVFFQICVGLVACLLFYKQIRSHKYEWWWSIFTLGSSSGFYIFLLSISWLLYASTRVPSNMRASYALWFAFGSFAVAIIGGFVAVASVILFSRFLYTFLLKRAQDQANVQSEIMESAAALEPLHEPRAE